MFHSVSAFIGLRYAKSSKGNHFIAFINAFSAIGIALGLMSLITVLSVMNGFEGDLKDRILGIAPHVVVDTQGESEQIISSLSQLPGVIAASDFIESEGVVQSSRSLEGVMIQGIEPQTTDAHSIIAENMMMGQINDLTPGSYGIIVGRALSTRLDLRLGEQTRILSAQGSVFGPFGQMPSQRLFTVVGIYDVGSELDSKVILMNINDSAKLMRNKVSRIAQTRLFLQDPFEYKSVVDTLAEMGLSSDDWRTRQGPLFDAVKMEKNMMALMLVLIIAVAAFNIVSALVMVVTEKKGDIAILLTQGLSRSRVMQVFLFNGLYNGIKGTLFGAAGGLLLVSQLNNLLSLFDLPIMAATGGVGLPIEMHWHQIVLLILFSLLLCFAASIYPAYRAVKVDPASALKYE
ncbi:MAG: lipoprotein-releasing system transmembrane subunit LolC [Alteromonadaceae bacterium]|jgi:lipoprotein-releasing system permease protein|uniref:lipoprotein-releasing ABC transporter permease subunit n=1 Tax=Paraglaciecola chathamensis TaxID=368405 RepID=UPI000C6A7ED5|nr:lipoprotein-releasing ABC transporter permease subunit [Paraglaciecola agarilytica]MBN26506.1 lipoprotein-releasing system transmembrane subunit LolC [Alteromonadaceae bacterium]|tara:strand:- start:91604 stop:92815 length:1212 start_codon:yes stop_codon:yes gene_type:complete